MHKIDLHSMSERDAIAELNIELKRMKELGIKQFEVVFGKGEGILKKAVTNILKRSNQVEDYAFPHAFNMNSYIVNLK